MATDELKKDYTLKVSIDIYNCLEKYQNKILYDDQNVNVIETTEILTTAIFVIYKSYLEFLCSEDQKELAKLSAYAFLEHLSVLYFDIKGD